MGERKMKLTMADIAVMGQEPLSIVYQDQYNSWNFTADVEIDYVGKSDISVRDGKVYHDVTLTEVGQESVTVQISEDELQALVERAEEAGVNVPADFAQLGNDSSAPSHDQKVVVDGGTEGIRGLGLSVTTYEDGVGGGDFLGGGYSLAGDLSVEVADGNGRVILSVEAPDGQISRYELSAEDAQAVIEYRVGEEAAAPLVAEMDDFAWVKGNDGADLSQEQTVIVENRGRAGGMVVIVDGQEEKLPKFGGREVLAEKYGFTPEQVDEAFGAYQERREFTVPRAEEFGSVDLEQQTKLAEYEDPADKYEGLRVRCPCGPMTWEGEGLMASPDVPGGINPPDSYLAAAFTEVGNQYNSLGAMASLVPDSTVAKPEQEAPQQNAPEFEQTQVAGTTMSMNGMA